VAVINERCLQRRAATEQYEENLDRRLAELSVSVDRVARAAERTSKNVIRLAVANDVEVDEVDEE